MAQDAWPAAQSYELASSELFSVSHGRTEEILSHHLVLTDEPEAPETFLKSELEFGALELPLPSLVSRLMAFTIDPRAFTLRKRPEVKLRGHVAHAAPQPLPALWREELPLAALTVHLQEVHVMHLQRPEHLGQGDDGRDEAQLPVSEAAAPGILRAALQAVLGPGGIPILEV